jgi:POT family proton-dependent oligopeptide transporter
MELWERFALHGMRSLLTLYLLHQVLTDRNAAWGMTAFRHDLEGLWGPLSVLAVASQMYGLYVALTYLAVPLGGLLGDRLFGRRRAVLIGGVVAAGGHACLTLPHLLLPALLMLIVSTGLLKANLAAQLGDLHPRDDPDRGVVFARYLVFLNIGVMLGPLICGWLAHRLGWQYGFAAASAAMLVGLAVYARLPESPKVARPIARPEVGIAKGGSIPLALATIGVTILAFSAYEQVSNLFLVWIERAIRLNVGGVAIPPAWFVAADGVLTIAMVFLTSRLPPLMRMRGADRLIAGCAAIVIGYALLATLSLRGTGDMWEPLIVLACLDLGIALIWPAALEIVTAAAPEGWSGAMVGLFYLHGFFANLVVGAVGALYERMSAPSFWTLHAGIAGTGVVLALIIRPRLVGADRRGGHWATA